MGSAPTCRRRRGGRSALAALLSLSLCVALGATAGDAAAKKKKGSSVFTQTKAVNAAVPNNVPGSPSTPLLSTLTVGKSFKGKVVGDVNVTGITTTGSGAGAADDLSFLLTAPSGRSVQLISSSFIGDVSIGPLTLDDDTRTSICDSATLTCEDPDLTLLRPFAGTANLLFLGSGDTGPLSAFNGRSMKGTWTIRVWDEAVIGTTSTFNSWGLKITAAKPVKS